MNEHYMEQVRQAFAEPQVRQAFEAMGVALGEAAKALGKVVLAAADMAAALLHGPLRDADAWYKALNWAKRQYPEWVAIMNRTKKRRVRKKYHDRILRAYKEVQI